MVSVVSGWKEDRFEHDGIAHPVYRRGSGPPVIVIHEIPGITPDVARFANVIADAHFSVAMPSMFGIVGRKKTLGASVTEIARACVSREFHVLATRGSSPLTDWLRALARALHSELGGRGVGAIGMCITGNFALAMAVDPAMMAPVLCQPSLPFPIDAERRRALHISDSALATVKLRCAKEGLRVLGLRFTGDAMSPPERFAHLRAELGDAFEAIEIDSARGNADGIPMNAHSVVTQHFVDRQGHPTRRAQERVLSFFAERLR